MARFNLKNKAEDPALILLVLRIRGQRFVYSTGIKVPLKYWDVKRGRVKSPHLYRPAMHINNVLDKIETVCDTFYAAGMDKGGWDFSLLRSELDVITMRGAADENTLGGYIRRSIERRRRKMSPLTIAKYEGLVNHLEAAKLISCPLSAFSRSRLHAFNAYLEKCGMKENTIAKQQKTLFAFLREAEEDGLKVDPAYKARAGRVAFRPADSVYLTEEELSKLKKYAGGDHLERVRDMLLAGCRTGLRWSDWGKIRPGNVRQVQGVPVLFVDTQKTNQGVAIPLHEDVRRLFEKYGSELPTMAQQVFNRSVKELCREMKIGKAEKISSHTCRRTFATLAYKAGIPPLQIAKITGHRTEKALLTYIRVDAEESAAMAGRHEFFKNKT